MTLSSCQADLHMKSDERKQKRKRNAKKGENMEKKKSPQPPPPAHVRLRAVFVEPQRGADVVALVVRAGEGGRTRRESQRDIAVVGEEGRDGEGGTGGRGG
ncbi:hypothetical protein T492DRAFT_1146721 [Pavlovales sp. CCMP2436]|nr:hypothetical protein T492DRAFT_1146721 [Pavlovales sp. CCMP2436]